MSLFEKAALPILITVGLYSGIHISTMTWTGLAPCPKVIGIPVCYIVSFGYALMFIFSLADQVIDRYPKPFLLGWGIVFIIACLGAGTELIVGNTCPKSSLAIPLCYISFVLCLVILYLYKRIHRRLKVRA